MGINEMLAEAIAVRGLIRQRNQMRRARLIGAMNSFPSGSRVMLSNGTTGTVLRARRTRFLVQGDDGRKWTAPPTLMTKI